MLSKINHLHSDGKISQCPFGKNCQSFPDEKLVIQVKKEKDCYLCLMLRYENKIQRYIKRISGVSDETSQDILQNVFLKAYLNLNAFNPQLKFSTWLYRIAHNETINHWRCHSRRNDSNLSWDDNEALKNVIKDPKNIEHSVYQRIINQQMNHQLTRLKGNYKEVVRLNYIDGLSYQEISLKLKKPIGTVGTLLNRGKKLLRQKLLRIGFSADIVLR